jgi:hypothetical protein
MASCARISGHPSECRMEHTAGENSSMECLREMQLPERESLSCPLVIWKNGKVPPNDIFQVSFNQLTFAEIPPNPQMLMPAQRE